MTDLAKRLKPLDALQKTLTQFVQCGTGAVEPNKLLVAYSVYTAKAELDALAAVAERENLLSRTIGTLQTELSQTYATQTELLATIERQSREIARLEGDFS